MQVAKPNFAANIHFTIGVNKSVAIIKFEEHWLNSTDVCDVFENDLIDEGAVSVIEYLGIDLNVQGTFVVDVLGEAKCDESPNYELVHLETVEAQLLGVNK
jgi:hypothetical protein